MPAPTNGSNRARLHRTLGVTDLVFLNICAILGIRWLSTAAQMGPSSLLLWVLAVLIYFIPSGFTVRELSSRDSGEGGVYRWTKSAFGELHAFVAGWTYWVNNLVYFPSLLLFIAGTFLFVGGDAWLGLGESGWYNAAFSLTLLWIIIGANVVGLKRGKWIQNIGAMATVTVFFLLAVSGIWAWTMVGSATDFAASSLAPSLTDFSTLTFFATMTFAFAGLELSSTMGDEIVDPARSIPRAMVISGLIVTSIYILGTGLLMVALPEGEIDVVTGIAQALSATGDRIALPGLAVVGTILVVMSATGVLAAWLAGAARMPYVIGIDRYLPEALGRTHSKWGTPHVALITQGVVVTVLMLAAVAGSTIEEANIMLLDMAIILYFIPFLYMFAALPVLRRKAQGRNEGVSLVPGGTAGLWCVSFLGFTATLLSVALALIPPAGTENPKLFLIKVAGGCALFIVAGLSFYFHGHKRTT